MKQAFKKGDKLVCIGNRDIEGDFPSDVVYTAVRDQEEGIFADRPYITVTAPHLHRNHVLHARRFMLHDGEALTPQKIEQLREQKRREDP